MRHFLSIVVFTFGFGGLAAGPLAPSALAETYLEGDSVILRSPVDVTVNGMLFGPSPGTTRAVQVRVMDDSPVNLRMKAWAERGLVRRGFVLGDDRAPLVFSIDTSGAEASPLPTENRTLPLLLHGQAGSLPGEDDVSVGLRVYSNNEASLIGGPAQAGRPVVGDPGQRVQVGLSERSTGKQIWVGWASIGETGMGDSEKLILLVGPLVEEAGRENRSQTITVPAGTLTRP